MNLESLQKSLKAHVFTLEKKEDVAIITMNDEHKSVNSLSIPVLEDLDTILKFIDKNQSSFKGLVFMSSKEDCFLAGADISIFETLTSQELGEKASRELQRIFGAFSDLKIPTLAAIHGVCLGGGLELSLACHYRIGSAHKSTSLGLPEVQLGLIPGGGGTQRLPRLIGIAASLDLILTGKRVDSKKALKLGLLDDVVPENLLLEKSISFLKSHKPKRLKDSVGFFDGNLQKTLLEGNPLGRRLIKSQATKSIFKSTKGKYPAPLKALEAVMEGVPSSLKKGLDLEAKMFGALIVSSESRSLVHVFDVMTEAKKNPCSKELQHQAKDKYLDAIIEGSSSVGILGAGLMGSGIATVLADKKIRTVLVDKNPQGLQKGIEAIDNYFLQKVQRRSLKGFEKTIAVGHVTPSLDVASLKGSPVLIEAVFEDLKVKGALIKELESSGFNGIFASNTSSLPITKIAEFSSDPSKVIGMHFFSPVPRMPLVEIIKTPKTAAEVTSVVFDLASKMGKNIIVVNDGPGFYTTRILAFQIAEALLILSEGAHIEDIDKAMESFGMPVGPITLLDEVGIDVGEHIMTVLGSAFADRLLVPKEMAQISKEERKGRKNNFGFYKYVEGKKEGPDETIYKHFSKRQDIKPQDIIDRCVYVFLNEAARCLDDKILSSENQGDLGAIFGLGFPPFLGGPFFYGHKLGKKAVLSKLTELNKKHGERFKPAAYWSR